MTLTDHERFRLRCAHYCATIATGAFVAILQLTSHLPTGVLLP